MIWLDYILLVISVLLIVIIVLQNPKEDAMNTFSGEKSDRAKMKQRGFEKTVNYITTGLAAVFFVSSLLLMILN
ncbi:MAG: preprotein translocase subunit SecG [Ignavibacteria bacterium]|nr:preprotein translocase subunit SecG [Ignavibacteria bacterium]